MCYRRMLQTTKDEREKQLLLIWYKFEIESLYFIDTVLTYTKLIKSN